MASIQERRLMRSMARWIKTHDIYGHMAEELLDECKAVLNDDGQFLDKDESSDSRTDKQILADLVEACIEHEGNRDDELEFLDDHGIDPVYWDEDHVMEHHMIVHECRKSYERLKALIREAEGDEKAKMF